MKREYLKRFLKKKVWLFLKNKSYYKGEIVEFDEDCLVIRDKFVGEVILSFDNISLISEDRKDKGEEDGGNFE